MQLWFVAALTPQGWADDVRITVRDGRIAALQTDVKPTSSDERFGVALPGMPNLHSHAFQRGMAGLTESAGRESDSFWSWRQLMYRFLDRLTPDDMQIIAAMAYIEMLEAGFTRVGEFHYVHHNIDGSPYDDPAEMMQRIAAASDETGIALTLLPVFYAHSGFGGQPPVPGQRRFISSMDGYVTLLDGARRVVGYLDGANVGVAPHSLRAVMPDELKAVAELGAGGPIHIHVAEQTREVEDCIAWSSQRPVAWLLDHLPVNTRWCLIHATHTDAHELKRIAEIGAIVGLCPITEANLGDGVFDARDFVSAGGRFGIGSDSNVLINLAGEMAMLEYGQRLTQRARNVLADRTKSTGRTLFDSAHRGGLQALGQSGGGLEVGQPADIVSLRLDKSASANHLARRNHDTVIDTWTFANRTNNVESVWRAGKQVVRGGIHIGRESMEKRFCNTLEHLTRE